jgi:hypothetical protein
MVKKNAAELQVILSIVAAAAMMALLTLVIA